MRRIVIWGLVLVGTVSLVVLAFSDRAPDVVESIAHPVEDAVISVAHSVGIEGPAWWDAVRDSPDVVFHVLQWAAVAGALVVLAAGRVRTGVIAAGLVVVSSAIEALQVQLSATRGFEVGDLLGNVLGISLGAVGGLAVLAANALWRQRHTPTPAT